MDKRGKEKEISVIRKTFCVSERSARFSPNHPSLSSSVAL
jgi:hypothetical protein